MGADQSQPQNGVESLAQAFITPETAALLGNFDSSRVEELKEVLKPLLSEENRKGFDVFALVMNMMRTGKIPPELKPFAATLVRWATKNRFSLDDLKHVDSVRLLIELQTFWSGKKNYASFIAGVERLAAGHT
jgi:hypothetical protein